MKTMKIAMMVLATMISFGCSHHAEANDGEFIEKGLLYEILDDGTVAVGKVSDKSKPKGKLVIPDKVTHDGKTYVVSTINSWGFFGCDKITSVVLPASVTNVDIWAFTGCNGLKEFTFPPTVTRIGYCVLESCENLERVTLSPNITTIEDRLLKDCKKLQQVDLPSGITSIGNSSFSGMTIKSLTIPEGVTSIAPYAFAYNEQLEEIVLPSSLRTIGGDAFTCCKALKTVTLPEGVTELGSNVFSYCSSLEQVSLPASLVSMEGNVFSSCPAMKSYEVSPSSTHFAVYDNLLYSADMSELIACPMSHAVGDFVVPKQVKKISEYAFYNNQGITSLTMTGVEYIGESAFNDCHQLARIDLGTKLKTLSKFTFYNLNKIETVTLPWSLEEVPMCLFDFCRNLKMVTVPKHMLDDEMKFNNNAFQFCPDDLKFKIVDVNGKQVKMLNYDELPDVQKYMFRDEVY